MAALSHPNIVAIHDVGTANGTAYVVMELLDGASLRQMLASGPLPVRRVLDHAIQMARALAGAHEKGIVHRDLKPENVFVMTDGRVKILDFGLAQHERMASLHGSMVATTVESLTTPRTILGTVGYMAPEQVRGEAVDHRCDVFAFGTVVYEMLAGQRAFQRNSSVEAMAAILNDEPPELVTAGPHQIPPALERTVSRCLEKSPGQRFQCAKDLSFALENIAIGTSGTEAVLTTSSAQHRWRRAGAILAAVAVLAALVAVVRGLLMRPEPLPAYRQVTFRKGGIESARFTPDGQAIIYTAAWDHLPFKLYSSRVDGTDMRELDLPPSVLLAVSRSGELALLRASLRGNRLARAPLAGGAPRELLANVSAADWSPDGKRLAVARRLENGKLSLEYPIGTSLYTTIGLINSLRISPQGDAIAFLDHPIGTDSRGTVAVVDLKGNTRTLTREWEDEWGLAWSRDGSEIWFTAGGRVDENRASYDQALYAVTRSGKQRLVLRIPGEMQVEDIAADGRVLFMRRDLRFEVTVGQVGGETHQANWGQYLMGGGISRDGSFAVLADWGTHETEYSVYLTKFDGSGPVRLGNGAAHGISPDNKWVASILPREAVYLHTSPFFVGSVCRDCVEVVFASSHRMRCAFQNVVCNMAPQRLMAVSFSGDTVPLIGVPQVLFQTQVVEDRRPMSPKRDYTWSRDGQRVVISTAPEETNTLITVVLNWTAALKK